MPLFEDGARRTVPCAVSLDKFIHLFFMSIIFSRCANRMRRVEFKIRAAALAVLFFALCHSKHLKSHCRIAKWANHMFVQLFSRSLFTSISDIPTLVQVVVCGPSSALEICPPTFPCPAAHRVGFRHARFHCSDESALCMVQSKVTQASTFRRTKIC